MIPLNAFFPETVPAECVSSRIMVTRVRVTRVRVTRDMVTMSPTGRHPTACSQPFSPHSALSESLVSNLYMTTGPHQNHPPTGHSSHHSQDQLLLPTSIFPATSKVVQVAPLWKLASSPLLRATNSRSPFSHSCRAIRAVWKQITVSCQGSSSII